MPISEKELEIEALGALFNPDEYAIQNDTVSIKISMCNLCFTVSFDLPSDYPQSQPLLSFHLNTHSQDSNKSPNDDFINNLIGIAQNSMMANAGYPCIYSTVEDIKEYITTQAILANDNADNYERIGQTDYICENEVTSDHEVPSNKLITYDEFKEWTNKFIEVLIERGDLPPKKISDKLTGRQIFEQLTNEQFTNEKYSEHLYAESPQISDFEETPTLSN